MVAAERWMYTRTGMRTKEVQEEEEEEEGKGEAGIKSPYLIFNCTR
jgi:hypothetical protein